MGVFLPLEWPGYEARKEVYRIIRCFFFTCVAKKKYCTSGWSGELEAMVMMNLAARAFSSAFGGGTLFNCSLTS